VSPRERKNRSLKLPRLTLAGGFGFLTGEHGLALDNLVSATVVTGTGEVVNTSGDDDLLWAIRGGGSNFGVVTSFTFKLHDQRLNVFFGCVTYEAKYLEEVFDAARERYAGTPDPKSAILAMLPAAEVQAQG
jgi:FAD/FMN-containing dehydrogenase